MAADPAHRDRAQIERLKPRSQVRSAGGPALFEAFGDDPQMAWTAAEADGLGAHAAVRIRVGLEPLEGRLVEPCVYVDWGDGWTEETRVRLRRLEADVYTAVAHSNSGPCRSVRLDPSSAPSRFRVTEFSVEPSGEASEHLRKLTPARQALRATVRRLPAPAQALLRTGRDLVDGDAKRRSEARRRLGRRFRVSAGGTDPWREAWVHGFEVARNLRSPHYAAPLLKPPATTPETPRLIAFHLPQFHPFPENDAWWGRGFTEWTNVSKATPQFRGHYQPRLPADLGWYDLRLPEVLREQARLAETAGVGAFCLHYYWFGGRRLLERPLDAFVADETITLPFCLCWANENWTRRWDGKESEVLMGQQHSPEDDRAVLDDLARYMRQPRYLRVNGRPVLLVYRPDILPDAAATVARWRERARETGLGELFLLCSNAFGFSDYQRLGFDGVVEFPPHAISTGEITEDVERLNAQFGGRVYHYPTVAEAQIAELRDRDDPRFIPGVMPSWDNEARRPGTGHAFHEAAPEPYWRWLSEAMATSRRLAPPEERLVFINAWNEWAEGAYLEPDRWFGHAFLQATHAAVQTQAPRLAPDHPLLAQSQAGFARSKDAAVLLHLFYPELIDWFGARLGQVGDLDLLVTVPDLWSEADLARAVAALPRARFTVAENRGRDILPFMQGLKTAGALGYPLFLKLHSKRSPHTADGDEWRDRLVTELVGGDAVARARAAFAADGRLGMLAAERARMLLSAPGVVHNNAPTMDRLARMLDVRWGPDTPFAAGSMFWGRTAAFARLAEAAPERLSFEPELGRIDGTVAHALERLTAAVALASGHTVEWTL
jgi:lipopolysaccharide biosynthesis protein